MMDDAEGQQEDAGGNRRQRNQTDINSAMQPLTRTAALTGGKVLFIVAAHLGRKARNIVAPACQNLAYNGINALAHTGYRQMVSVGAFCAASMTRFCSNVICRPKAFSAARSAISG